MQVGISFSAPTFTFIHKQPQPHILVDPSEPIPHLNPDEFYNHQSYECLDLDLSSLLLHRIHKM